MTRTYDIKKKKNKVLERKKVYVFLSHLRLYGPTVPCLCIGVYIMIFKRVFVYPGIVAKRIDDYAFLIF